MTGLELLTKLQSLTQEQLAVPVKFDVVTPDNQYLNWHITEFKLMHIGNKPHVVYLSSNVV